MASAARDIGRCVRMTRHRPRVFACFVLATTANDGGDGRTLCRSQNINAGDNAGDPIDGDADGPSDDDVRAAIGGGAGV